MFAIWMCSLFSCGFSLRINGMQTQVLSFGSTNDAPVTYPATGRGVTEIVFLRATVVVVSG
ncbi:hypothetical protein Hanom_Chr17g01561691 [Helianthus anomalus]